MGLLKEVLSLLAYVLAFVAAIWWGPRCLWLAGCPWIETTVLRMGVAYAAVFVVVLLGVGLVNMTLSALIRTTGLSPADHGLGGLLRAGAGRAHRAGAVVTVAGYTPLPQEAWWRDAMFSAYGHEAVKHTKVWLPPSLASMLPY